MAILAECDICGNQHRVKDSLAGNAIRCRECGVEIAVPFDLFITPEAFVEEKGRLRPRVVDQENTLWPRVIAVVVTCSVMVALLGAVWVLVRLWSPAAQQFRAQPKLGLRRTV